LHEKRGKERERALPQKKRVTKKEGLTLNRGKREGRAAWPEPGEDHQ